MKNIMLVAQDDSLLQEMSDSVKALYPNSKVRTFHDSMLAVQYAFNHLLDMVCCQVDMPRLSGFDMVRLLHKGHPGTVVCLAAEDRRYESRAQREAADGFIVRPVSEEKLRAMLEKEDEVLW